MPITCRQRLGQNMIKVQLGNRAVPIRTIVELDIWVELEAILLATRRQVGDRPRLCEGRLNDSPCTSTVLEALIIGFRV